MVYKLRQPKGSNIFAAMLSEDLFAGGNEAANSVTLLSSKKKRSLLVSQFTQIT